MLSLGGVQVRMILVHLLTRIKCRHITQICTLNNLVYFIDNAETYIYNYFKSLHSLQVLQADMIVDG